MKTLIFVLLIGAGILPPIAQNLLYSVFIIFADGFLLYWFVSHFYRRYTEILLDKAEYELGNFVKNVVYSLQEYAASKQVILKVETDFKYASVWIDPGKISPVIKEFVKNAIDLTEMAECVTFTISINSGYWEIKTKAPANREPGKCYKCKQYQLFHRQTALECKFAKGSLCQKLLKLCKGKILLNNSESMLTLRFPVTCLPHAVSQHPETCIGENHVDQKIDAFFCKPLTQRNSLNPIVVLVESDEFLRSYLEACLAENYVIKSFGSGTEVLAYLREEHTDLVVCNIQLQGMGGDELSLQLKKTSVIPVLLYSSSMCKDQRIQRENSLADIFWRVPFDIEDLKIEMSVLIKNSRLLRKSFLKEIFGEPFIEMRSVRAFNGMDYDLINRVKDIIVKNLEREDFTINDIAAELGMSRSSFFKKWKPLTGEGPSYLISRIRLEKAHELLESGNYKVADILSMIGRNNGKTFRESYKKHFGVTPLESKKEGMKILFQNDSTK